MARTPSKRWVEMVEKVPQSQLAWSQDDGLTYPAEVVSRLLSRQHAAFVRLVKKCKQQCIEEGKADNSVEGLGYWHVKEEACDDILAALQQGGKK